MLRWMAAHGYPAGSLEGQARYMVHEAMVGGAGMHFPRTRAALMRATAANVRATALTVGEEFENPRRGPGANFPARQSTAEALERGYKPGAHAAAPPVNPNKTTTPNKPITLDESVHNISGRFIDIARVPPHSARMHLMHHALAVHHAALAGARMAANTHHHSMVNS
jgi:hypothetical protein